MSSAVNTVKRADGAFRTDRRVTGYVAFSLIPLAVGGLSAFLSRDGMMLYESLNKPFLSPPSIVFPIAWTILYTLMGCASYRVYTARTDGKTRKNALTLYAVQLALNFFWPLVFFGKGAYLAAFLLLVGLFIAALSASSAFYRIDRPAGLLMIPYTAWLIFAMYLNFSVFLLNG